MLGDTSVGKSSLVKRFAFNSFFEFEEPTIGAAFICKDVVINNKNIRAEIWDTAGQERYKSLTPMYFRNANIAIIVFDLTNKDSFMGIEYWLQTLEEKGPTNIFKVLVGNKKDIQHKKEITSQQIKNYTDKYNILYFETSAKIGTGVNELFTEIFKQDIKEFEDIAPNIQSFSDFIEKNDEINNKELTCC